MAKMKQLSLIVICLSLLLSACGTIQMPFTVTITPPGEEVRQTSPQIANSPEAPASETPQPSATVEVSATPSQAASPTATATITMTSPPPTETLLPPIEIPTEKPNMPSFIVWTGEPTYPGDSEPGRLFRVDYDPDVWAQTKDNFEQVVLAHRTIAYCTISAWSGRGLPPDAKVEHIFGQVGDVPFDINYVTMQGTVKFVAYVGGDKRLLTGFQVSLTDQKDQCLLDAEAILATLRSFVAEPTITPTFTPEPLETETATP
jgi:hypothetical protein